MLVSSSENASIRVDKYDVKKSECKKQLGAKFDTKLIFENRITDICSKASRKIYALVREAPYLDISKRWILMNAFVNYFPLVWMCHNRTANRKINRLYESCLRTIYNDKQKPFEELLEKDGSVTIYDRNIQYLAVEMYKVSNGLSSAIISDIFKHKNSHPHNLRHDSQFSTHLVKTVFHGTERISYLGPTIRM